MSREKFYGKESPKIGDIVRIKQSHGGRAWPEAEGKIGFVMTEEMRQYIPAAKVMLLGQIAEFDLDELEVIDGYR